MTTVRARLMPVLLSGLLCLLPAGCDREGGVRLADGAIADWSEWRGQWLLINYWAEWCAPCRKEIPELNRIHAESDDVVVLGVNFDNLEGPPLTDLIGRMDIRFPVLLDDPGTRWQQQRPGVLPSTLVINPQGELHDVLIGPQTYESLSRAVSLTTMM